MLAQQHAQERAEMSNLAGVNTDLNRQNADLNIRLRDAVSRAERKEAV
jgi:cell division protein FtsB